MKRLASLLVAVVSIVACSSSSSDGTSSSGADGGDPSPAIDAASSDAKKDDGSAPRDGGSDVVEGGEGGLPPLCTTYPDDNIAYEGELAPRWKVIAYRAMELGAADCAITALVDLHGTKPAPVDCYAAELRAIAGCLTVAGTPATYDATTTDVSQKLCLPAVKIGFKNAAPSSKDVERFITLTKNAAVDLGMAAADAARLEQLLLAKKSSAVVSASSDYTQSSCDGGI